jgi:hypothetical protein
MQRAQVSADFSIVFAAMILIFTLIIIIFFSNYLQLRSYSNYILAKDVLEKFSTKASSVYLQGPGAYEFAFISFPNFGINFSASFISNNTIKLYVNDFGDVYKNLDFNVSGYFFENQTDGYFLIYNNGSNILIQPAPYIYLSKNGFYFNQSNSAQSLIIQNLSPIPVFINVSLVSSCTSCTYSAAGLSTLAPGQSQEGSLSTGTVGGGLYTGYLKINLTNNYNYANYSLLLPITIKIN